MKERLHIYIFYRFLNSYEKNHFFPKESRRDFAKREPVYLEHIISNGGAKLETVKIQAILDLKTCLKK